MTWESPAADTSGFGALEGAGGSPSGSGGSEIIGNYFITLQGMLLSMHVTEQLVLEGLAASTEGREGQPVGGGLEGTQTPGPAPLASPGWAF